MKIGLTVKNAIMHFISNISRASRRGADQVPVEFGYLVGSRLIFEKVWIRFRIRIFKGSDQDPNPVIPKHPDNKSL